MTKLHCYHFGVITGPLYGTRTLPLITADRIICTFEPSCFMELIFSSIIQLHQPKIPTGKSTLMWDSIPCGSLLGRNESTFIFEINQIKFQQRFPSTPSNRYRYRNMYSATCGFHLRNNFSSEFLMSDSVNSSVNSLYSHDIIESHQRNGD